MPRGPGPVLAAHRLLIATAVGGAVLYALWELREYGRHGAGGSLLRAAAAAAVAVGLLVYLRSLGRLRTRLTPGRPGTHDGGA